MQPNKFITARLQKFCSVCGKNTKVIMYKGGNYRGGHYFGKLTIYNKKTICDALRAGTRKTRFGDTVINVLKKDPKPYDYAEYWECPRCYWQ